MFSTKLLSCFGSLILLSVPYTASATPISSFAETGAGFEFTLHDDSVSHSSGLEGLGSDWSGGVAYAASAGGVSITWDVQHLTEFMPNSRGMVSFPGGSIGPGVDKYHAKLELFQSSVQSDDIGQFEFTLQGQHIGSVPEPSVIILLVTGLAGLGFNRRDKKLHEKCKDDV